jgi:nitroreductase
VRDPEQKQRIAALNREAVLAYAGPGGSRAASVSHQDPAKRERQRQAVLWQAEHLAAAPALIFACLELGEARPDTFAAGAGAGGSIWPGVQNLLLAARALGLGAALTTLVLRDRAAVKAVLTLPETIEPFCMVPVGYPVGQFGPVTRRPVAEVMRWDRWS